MPYQYLLHVSCLDIPLLAVTGMCPWSYQRGGLCEGCLGRVVIHLCRAMSCLRRKDCLHVSQIKGCQEVSPSAGCSPILAALLVALLCSSSCSLLLVLLSRPLCHFCLHSALSCTSVYQVLSSMSNFLRSFLTLSRHLIFVPCRGRAWGSQPNSSFLGTLSPSILARCPSQRRCLTVMVSSSYHAKSLGNLDAGNPLCSLLLRCNAQDSS